MVVLYYVAFACTWPSREHSIDKNIKHTHTSLTSYVIHRKSIPLQTKAPEEDLRPPHKSVQQGEPVSGWSIFV